LIVADWLGRYGRAWETADADAAAELFTPDAIYRSHPSREAHTGRAAIRAYWRSATATQADVSVRFGRPIVEGAHVAVEWWTTMREGDGNVTLSGCLVLRFAADGRCQELREYWHLEDERREPPPGWGQ
jgi:uncharacterized protein (TIGR02246 family)